MGIWQNYKEKEKQLKGKKMALSFNKLMEQSPANHQLVGWLAGWLALYINTEYAFSCVTLFSDPLDIQWF